MSTTTVHRTTNPDLLALWDETQRTYQEHRDAVKAYMDEVWPGDRKLVCVKSSSGVQIIGVQASWSERDTFEPTWRYVNKDNCLVPRKSLNGKPIKEGREAAERIAGLSWRNPLAKLDGQPPFHFSGLHMHSPGVNVWGGFMWVTWGCEITDDMVDLDIWEPVKLSTYYAAKEAHECEPVAS